MTTATTHRLQADNDFPVLMRLPDLNAPVWAAPLVPQAKLLSVEEGTSSSAAENLTLPSQVAAAVGSAANAVTSEKTSTPAQSPPRENSTTAVAHETTSKRAPLLARLQPYLPGDGLSPKQWTLVRQIAGGAILVGGLALTYMAMMSGGEEPTPDHIPIAQQTTEPPLIEFEGGASPPELGHVIVPPQDTPSTNPAISDVSPPPEFNLAGETGDYRNETHVRVAEMEESPSINRAAVPPVNPRAFADREAETMAADQADRGEYRGRIGSSVTVHPAELPKYPKTNPDTYLYRPSVPSLAPSDERPYEARLRGTIAPPPLR